MKSLSPAVVVLLMALNVHAMEAVTPWIEVMKQADTDADGNVSMNEVKEYAHNEEYVGFQAFMADHFIDLDANDDGMVSVEELRSGLMRLGISDDEISEGFAKGFAFMSKN
jgi:Ca2+-binding EF-hand superfamily protein